MITIFFFLWTFNESSLIPIQTFEPPTGDEYLGLAHASCFSPDGRLYVVDPSQPRILVWNADGSFRKGFGEKGEGPGEILEPIQIAFHDGRVFVWQRNGKITRFTSDGDYQESFQFVGPWPRRFAMLDHDRALINYRQTEDNGKVFYVFDIRHRNGDVNQLNKFHNHGFMEMKPGDNNARIKGYMADVDIQATPDGTFWYGFGYEKKLYHLSKDGKLLEERAFQLPNQKPSDEDRTFFESKSVALGDGRRITLKNLPNLDISFDADQAYFTQFVIKGDRVAFILTSQGGTDSAGDGDWRASYYISHLKTGELLSRGAYKLTEDSQVHYRNGRIAAFILDEDGSVQVQEVTLKGLNQ